MVLLTHILAKVTCINCAWYIVLTIPHDILFFLIKPTSEWDYHPKHETVIVMCQSCTEHMR